MAGWSPTLEGFRAIFRRPSVPLAEVIWRWCFGGTALLLAAFAAIEYFDTLPVSNADLFYLRTGQPFLISQAISCIFAGSGLRFVIAAIVLSAALAILWIVLASIGRGATVDDLLRCVRERAREVLAARKTEEQILNGEAVADTASSHWRLRSIAGLHFLRAGLGLAATLACFAVVIFAPLLSTKEHPHPAIVFLLTLFFLFAVWLIWSSVSWFVSLASIFIVREGDTTFGALASALNFCLDRSGPVAVIGTWFGLTHVVLFFAASSVLAFPLSLVGLLPVGFVITVVAILALVYFAIVDTLYVARLAGYVAILEAPPMVAMAVAAQTTLAEMAPTGFSTQHSALSVQPESAMVDQEELILGDRGDVESPGPPLDDPGSVSDKQ
jgi:hypothetical protein